MREDNNHIGTRKPSYGNDINVAEIELKASNFKGAEAIHQIKITDKPDARAYEPSRSEAKPEFDKMDQFTNIYMNSTPSRKSINSNTNPNRGLEKNFRRELSRISTNDGQIDPMKQLVDKSKTIETPEDQTDLGSIEEENKEGNTNRDNIYNYTDEHRIYLNTYTSRQSEDEPIKIVPQNISLNDTDTIGQIRSGDLRSQYGRVSNNGMNVNTFQTLSNIIKPALKKSNTGSELRIRFGSLNGLEQIN